MEDDLKKIIEMIKIAISIIAVIALIIIAAGDAKEKEYELICETREEIIITDGEDIIKIEKEETEQENEK